MTTDRDNNEPINRLYREMGFAKTREYVTREGRWLNEYVYRNSDNIDGNITIKNKLEKL